MQSLCFPPDRTLSDDEEEDDSTDSCVDNKLKKANLTTDDIFAAILEEQETKDGLEKTKDGEVEKNNNNENKESYVKTSTLIEDEDLETGTVSKRK